MPVILAAPNIDRDVVEPVAVAMQREADRHVPAMAKYIAQSMRNGVDAIDDKLLRRGIETHDLTSVIAAIPELAPSWWPVVPLTKAQNTTGNTLADKLTEQFGDSARLAVSLAPRFDVVNPHAVEWAQQRAGKLLTDLDAQALHNARSAVAYGIEHGRTVDQTARYLKSTLYLPPRGQQAVTNYFDALVARVEKGDDIQEAARAAAQGRALAPKQFRDAQNIDTLTERYADRWAKYSAEAQARTLTIEASNAGLRGGWNEAADAHMFDPTTATIVWYATPDDLVCPECAALNGTEVAFVGGTFDTSFAGATETPPAHVNCRCTLVLITKAFNPAAQPPRLNPHTPPATSSKFDVVTESGLKNGDLGVRRMNGLLRELDTQGVDADAPIRGVIDHSSYHVAVARDTEGQIRGALAFKPNDGGTAVLEDLRSMERGSGVGTALLQHAAQSALDASATEMKVYSAVPNAVPFYARMGGAASENPNSAIITWSNDALRALADGNPIPFTGEFPAWR